MLTVLQQYFLGKTTKKVTISQIYKRYFKFNKDEKKSIFLSGIFFADGKRQNTYKGIAGQKKPPNTLT